MIIEYEKRRNLFIGQLEFNEHIDCNLPYGAFYAFVDVNRTGLNDEEFCHRLLQNYNVAACPGHYFGQGGSNYVRFCFATSTENIRSAADRLNKLSSDLVC